MIKKLYHCKGKDDHGWERGEEHEKDIPIKKQRANTIGI